MTIDTVKDQPLDMLELSGDKRFIDPDIRPTVLAELISDKYDMEWLGWEPETLWQTIKQDFHTDVHTINKDKINSIKTLLMVDDFWLEWHIFENIVKAFNNQSPSFYFMEGCTPGEMSWAIEESTKIRVEKFNDEVMLYVRANCLNYGLIAIPPQLSAVRADFDDIYLKGLQAESMNAWTEIKDSDDFTVDEDAIGVQLARLNSIRHYIQSMEDKSKVIEEKGKVY